jgi:hypothetical protein
LLQRGLEAAAASHAFYDIIKSLLPLCADANCAHAAYDGLSTAQIGKRDGIGTRIAVAVAAVSNGDLDAGAASFFL